MYAGVVIFQNEKHLTLRHGLWLAAAGLILQLFETSYLIGKSTVDPMEYRMLAGNILFGIGMFLIAVNLKTLKLNKIAIAGRNYSLGIYILHPLFVPLLTKTFKYTPPPFASLWKIGISFFLSLFIIRMMEKYFPKAKSVFHGNITLPNLQFLKNQDI